MVATHPVQFTHRDDFEAREARVCIADGEILGNPRRVRRYIEEQYFKRAEQMQTLFADIPSALVNTIGVAQLCNLTLVLGKGPTGVKVRSGCRRTPRYGPGCSTEPTR